MPKYRGHVPPGLNPCMHVHCAAVNISVCDCESINKNKAISNTIHKHHSVYLIRVKIYYYHHHRSTDLNDQASLQTHNVIIYRCIKCIVGKTLSTLLNVILKHMHNNRHTRYALADHLCSKCNAPLAANHNNI